MIMDFSVLKDIVIRKVISKFDHSYLNDHFSNPTAEIVVNWIVDTIQLELPFDLELKRVRLWETSNSHTDWEANENK